MEGTEFQSRVNILFWSRKLGSSISFLFTVSSNCCYLLPVSFPPLPFSFPALLGTSGTVLPGYSVLPDNPPQTFVTCLPVSFLRSRFPA
jgi:hypothetical protein